MPKLASTWSLFQTEGYVPSLVALPAQPPGCLAIRRQYLPDLDVVGIVVVHAAADHQVAGSEYRSIVPGESVPANSNSHEQAARVRRPNTLGLVCEGDVIDVSLGVRTVGRNDLYYLPS